MKGLPEEPKQFAPASNHISTVHRILNKPPNSRKYMADESYFVWSKPHNPKIQPHVAPIRDIKPAKYKLPLFLKESLIVT